MKKTGIWIAVLAIVFSGIFTGGCEKGQATPDAKMGRLMSAENRQLKKDIDAVRKQMELQKQELDKCVKERQEWQYKAEKGLQEEVEKMASIAMTEHQRMTEEVEKLSTEIARLKGQKPEEKTENGEGISTPPPPPATAPAE